MGILTSVLKVSRGRVCERDLLLGGHSRSYHAVALVRRMLSVYRESCMSPMVKENGKSAIEEWLLFAIFQICTDMGQSSIILGSYPADDCGYEDEEVCFRIGLPPILLNSCPNCGPPW